MLADRRFAGFDPLEDRRLRREAQGAAGPAATLHAVARRSGGPPGAVSLHVYCRPDDECDIYDLERGQVRRVRLSYDSVWTP